MKLSSPSSFVPTDVLEAPLYSYLREYMWRCMCPRGVCFRRNTLRVKKVFQVLLKSSEKLHYLGCSNNSFKRLQTRLCTLLCNSLDLTKSQTGRLTVHDEMLSRIFLERNSNLSMGSNVSFVQMCVSNMISVYFDYLN